MPFARSIGHGVAVLALLALPSAVHAQWAPNEVVLDLTRQDRLEQARRDWGRKQALAEVAHGMPLRLQNSSPFNMNGQSFCGQSEKQLEAVLKRYHIEIDLETPCEASFQICSGVQPANVVAYYAEMNAQVKRKFGPNFFNHVAHQVKLGTDSGRSQ